jgi:polysaccharide export outer membrane protein
MIIVSAEDPEISMPFNLRSISVKSGQSGCGYWTAKHAIISGGRFWSIEFPVLGKLKVGGLSRSEVLQMLQQKKVYIKTNY